MGPIVARRHLPHAVGALLAAALLLSAVAVPGATAQDETDDEHEFSYDPHAENGPSRWGEIKPEWATCSDGRLQSPINLHRDLPTRRDLGYLKYSYKRAEAFIVNRGHDIMVQFNGDAGSLVIDGTVYHLKQLHWHTPAEHHLNGHKHDMELHLVHQTAENKTAVVAVLYEITFPVRRDPFLEKLERAIGSLCHTDGPIRKKVNPNDVGFDGGVYYRFNGSLTTPSCAEGIVWTVIPKLHPVAEYQMDLLRRAVHDGFDMNARPVQKVNHRPVVFSDVYHPAEPHVAVE